MKRPGNIFLLALLIGAISSALLYRYLREQQTRLEAARGAAVSAAADVVVAKELIPIGSRLEASDLRVTRWPTDSLPDGTAKTPEELVGKTVRVSIEKNSPVLANHVVSEDASLLPLLITEGMRGVSVKVDNVTGVSGFITPNSHVDVVASGSPDNETRDLHSRVILQNVRVLAVGTTIEMRDDKPVEVPTVTLLVAPAEAEKLTLASHDNPIRLALRNYRDEGMVFTPGAAMPTLFGEVAVKQAPMAVAHVSSPVAPRPAPSVEVVLGDQVTRRSY